MITQAFQVVQRVDGPFPNITYYWGHKVGSRQALYLCECTRCGVAISHAVPFEIEDLVVTAEKINRGDPETIRRMNDRGRVIPLKIAFEEIHRGPCRFGISKEQAYQWTIDKWKAIAQGVGVEELRDSGGGLLTARDVPLRGLK